jgi:hypothetical protein
MAAGGYQGSLIIKGTSTSNGTISATNFNRAHFVRIQTTAANNTITLKESDGSTVGSLILHDAGDSVVIEKKPTQTLETTGNAVGSAVGSPR